MAQERIEATWHQTGRRPSDGFYQTVDGWTRAHSNAWFVCAGDERPYLGWGDLDEATEKRFRDCALVLVGGPSDGLVLNGFTKVNWKE